jgi:Fe-S cluster biogenesis protein NfuA
MVSISSVKDNPNAKVATFEIGADYLGDFSKIIIPSQGDLVAYCPLAQTIFPKSKDITRIDLAARDGNTYITIARKFLDWKEEEIQNAQTHLESFFASNIEPVYLEALARDFAAAEPLETSNPVKSLVQQAFLDQVNPILAKDGGAMELVGVTLKEDTGEITADVALMGSCNGCGQAETATLEGATNKIREVLDAAKAQHTDNQDIQKLHFQGINIFEAPEVIVAKPKI